MPPVIVQSLFTDMHDEKDQSIRCTHTNTMWNKHSQSSHKTTKWVDSQKMPRRLGPSLNQSTRRLHTKPMLLRCREWSGTAKITAHTNPASPQNAFASKQVMNYWDTAGKQLRDRSLKDWFLKASFQKNAPERVSYKGTEDESGELSPPLPQEAATASSWFK